MGLIDVGSQLLYYDFKHPADSDEFNRLLRNIIKPGVYKGGSPPSHLGSNVVRIPPFQAFCNTRFGIEDELGVRVVTRTDSDISVIQNTPGIDDYVFIQMVWINAIENYADFKTRAVTDSAAENEVILARVQYDGGGNVVSVDEVGKSWGIFDENFNVIADKSLILKSSYLQLESIPAADVPAAPGTGKAVLYKKEGNTGLLVKNESDSIEINLLEAGGNGSGFSPLVAGFNESFYELITETDFSRDSTVTNTLINTGSTTATDGSSRYIFSSAQDILQTNTLVGINYAGKAAPINRLQALMRWSEESGKQDPISKVRVSKNGGISYYEISEIRQIGTREGNSLILVEYDNSNQDSNVALNLTSQVNLGQGFRVSSDSIIYSCYVNLQRVGTPGGRFRLSIRNNNVGVPSLTDILTETNWQRIEDIGSSGFLDYNFTFNSQVYLNKGVLYHLVIELEDVDEYNFITTTDELQWGADTSSPSYIDGQSSIGDGISFTGVSGTDLIFGITGTKILGTPTADISTGEVVFTKETHYERNSTITNYTGTEDTDVTINATTQQELAQQFQLDNPFAITQLQIRMRRTGTPGGQLECSIYDNNSGLPGNLLYTSLNRINANAISTSNELRTFKFNNIELNKETLYWFIVKGTSGYSPTGSDYIDIRSDSSSPTYLSGNGIMAQFNGTSWSTIATTTANFVIKGAYQEELLLATYDKANEATSQIDIDDGTSRERLGQSFSLQVNSVIPYIDLYMVRLGTPGGNAYIELYTDSSGEPGTLIETSDSIIIDEMSTSPTFVRFYFDKYLDLTKSTAYWIVLRVDSSYTYTDAVNEIQWFRDATTPNHLYGGGSSTFASATWSASSAIHVYTVYGYEAEILMEIKSRKLSTELEGFAIWYLFQDAYITSDPNQAIITLDSTMKSSGSVPISPIVGTAGRGALQAIINNHIFTGGVDFIEGTDTAYFDPSDLTSIDQIVFQKIKQGIHFGSPLLEINDRIRALPEPLLTLIDNETIEFNSTGGAYAVKAELPNGQVLTGPDGARVSFNASKNRYGGLGLDTGSESTDTEYYIYAVQQSGTQRDLSYVISSTKPSSGGPTGYQYWKYIDRFWNNSSANIEYPFYDEVIFDTVIATGTLPTYIWHFTNLNIKGSRISGTLDSINGDFTTINNAAIVAITCRLGYSSVGITGISINASSLTTSIATLAYNETVDLNHNGTNFYKGLSSTYETSPGDILRLHSNISGTPNTTPSSEWFLKISTIDKPIYL